MAEAQQPFHVQAAYFDALANPESGKTKEARWAGARLITGTKYGDKITLYCYDKTMDMIVGHKFWYGSIEEMLEVEGYRNLLPMAINFEHAVRLYKELRHQACGVENGPMIAVALKKV